MLKVNLDNASMNSSNVTATLDESELSIQAVFQTSTGNMNLYLYATTLNIYEWVEEGDYIIQGAEGPGVDSGLQTASCAYVAEGSSKAYISYWTDVVEAGKITITDIDRTNKTISGKFESKVMENKGSEILTFTKGSFTKISYTE